jgi:hypothetical protein
MMKDRATSPAAWAGITFYILIIAVLLMCVVTFALNASCLFTEPNLHSVTYSIVALGVGLSLVCGILWTGGVVGIVSISQSTQKALWFTLIAAILSITVTAFKGFFSTARVYKVTGFLEKTDGKDPRDISISDRSPPLIPAPVVKRNLAFEIWEDPTKGKLPTLLFLHPDYQPEEIDLNDRTKVNLAPNGELNIVNPVKLRPQKPVN